MTEIPVADPGRVSGDRPQEVKNAAWLVLLAALTGLIVSVAEYIMWEHWTSAVGGIMAIIGFWIYFQLLAQDRQAWNIAVMFNLAAIILYLIGENFPGAILSVIVFLYLNMANVKVHFQ